jgi:hypothetical protein
MTSTLPWKLLLNVSIRQPIKQQISCHFFVFVASHIGLSCLQFAEAKISQLHSIE